MFHTKPGSILSLLFLIGAIHFSSAQEMHQLVSPFQGSEYLGFFESRFIPLSIFSPPIDSRKMATKSQVEGELRSDIYLKPEKVANYEVFSSYKKELEKGGFEILLACGKEQCNVTRMISETFAMSGKEFTGRAYEGAKALAAKDWLATFTEYYIAAKKKTAEKTYHVSILIGREKSYYSVDVLIGSEMEEGTVVLSPELLRSRIKDDGKSVLEGIYFETGQAIIMEKSEPALEVITVYLKSNPDQQFYVVGHTDDTGTMASNITLSENRSKAVVQELQNRGIAASRLIAKGVGPFSPIASNQSEKGKDQNRRVELVLKIGS